MSLLIAGTLLWAMIHLMPAIAPDVRSGLVAKMGEKPYKGLFALSIFLSLVLVVIGWRSTTEQFVYVLPPATRLVAFTLICIAFILIGAANYPTAIKRVIRHPMLTGVAIWAAGHLLVNGTTRAIVLFGGLGVWALVEIVAINRRDGAYEKPPKPELSREIRGLVISAGIIVLLIFLHPYFAGVSPIPR
jgi:uncharacterized membrane protein